MRKHFLFKIKLNKSKINKKKIEVLQEAYYEFLSLQSLFYVLQ